MQKTIFVVDDVATNLAIAERDLEKQYNVITMSSAAKMFEALERLRPDLILLDIEMPEMSGFEAIKLLKANSSYAKIPVIFFSGVTDAAVQAQGIELGAIDFIEKPYSKPLLLNRIKNYLKCKDLAGAQTEKPKVNPKFAKAYIGNIQRNIDRLEEIINKKGSYEDSDLLTYYINNHAIKDALDGVGEWELAAVAVKLEQAGMNQEIALILAETPAFIEALRSVIAKYSLL